MKLFLIFVMVCFFIELVKEKDLDYHTTSGDSQFMVQRQNQSFCNSTRVNSQKISEGDRVENMSTNENGLNPNEDVMSDAIFSSLQTKYPSLFRHNGTWLHLDMQNPITLECLEFLDFQTQRG